jgi:hypothetical protein
MAIHATGTKNVCNTSEEFYIMLNMKIKEDKESSKNYQMFST